MAPSLLAAIEPKCRTAMEAASYVTGIVLAVDGGYTAA